MRTWKVWEARTGPLADWLLRNAVLLAQLLLPVLMLLLVLLLPVSWGCRGRSSGEVGACPSKGDTLSRAPGPSCCPHSCW